MNRTLITTLALALGALAAAPAGAAPKSRARRAKSAPRAKAADPFKDDDARALYAFGYKSGESLTAYGLSAAQLSSVLEGIRDGSLKRPAKVNVPVFLPKANDVIKASLAAQAAAEKKRGEAYSEKFAAEPGVKALPEGAGWIKVVKPGDGAQATPDDEVKVNYEGKLIDGTVFDSSYERHEPATFPLRGVIPCWTQGVSQLKVGGEAQLVCPSSAAYGDRGRPPVIPGGATLVFKVELLDATAPKGQ
ncbi:MAG: FKBP-type peptidyl-prolyl cis-trans isomerase [Elusimicrobia bacterium]|nr:FKBP-type peptidyl-prolyl cis-trans isomerase [Elusimicrobiota bacterium]